MNSVPSFSAVKKDKSPSLINVIFVLTILATLLIFMVLMFSLLYEKYSYFSDTVHKAYVSHLEYQKNFLRQRVENIVRIIEDDGLRDIRIKDKSGKGSPPSPEKEGLYLRYISHERFGLENDGYFYVVRKSDGIILMHPINPLLEGKDIRSIVDIKGTNIGHLLYRTINFSDDGFFRYWWIKPSTGDVVQKLAYARYSTVYDWIIVGGIYLDDIEKGIYKYQSTLKAEVIRNTLVIMLRLFAVLVLFWVVLLLIKKKFMHDLLFIGDSFRKAVLSREEVDTDILKFREFRGLAEYLNVIIEKNNQMYERLRYYAEKDPLTDLCNRRKFMENLEREFASCRRYGNPVSLLMMDLDHFKSINDTYGHAAGDHVLKMFARLLVNSIRDVDMPGRIGGEEFAVIMPNTEKDQAVIVAERIRKTLENSPVEYEGKKIAVTLSIGVASIPPAELERASDLLRIADENMYRAKKEGRNKVCF